MQQPAHRLSQARLEPLESRTLLAATPLTVVAALGADGQTQLQITATPGKDRIIVDQTPAGLLVRSGAWSGVYSSDYGSLRVSAGAGNDRVVLRPSVTLDAYLYGGNGGDTILGGSGSDHLYGGDGADLLDGGAGEDELLSIGGSARDQLRGGAGTDSFWLDARPQESVLDASPDEQALGAVHTIDGFENTLSAPAADTAQANARAAGLQGPNLPDPLVTSPAMQYRNFARQPLFARNGPSADDVRQGYVGDCYFLAVLSSIAKTDPKLIRQSIADLGDGTYAVQFVRGGRRAFVRVDADLPTWGGGSVAYAGLGAQGSTWVALMEKAYAFFRYGRASYISLSGGWMGEVYAAFGKPSTGTWSASSDQALLGLVQKELLAGRSVTWAVLNVPAGTPLVGNHAYSVDAVLTDIDGNLVGLRLRNPWGIDGAGNDGSNDGYITLTAAQAKAAFVAFVSAAV